MLDERPEDVTGGKKFVIRDNQKRTVNCVFYESVCFHMFKLLKRKLNLRFYNLELTPVKTYGNGSKNHG